MKLTPEKTLKFLDFGFAHAHGAMFSGESSITGHTRDYSPPEQFLPNRPGEPPRTDVRSDLYSVAATAYALLTASQPPIATHREADVKAGRPDPLRNPTDLEPRIPRALSAVLLGALSLNPDDRPASAADLRRMISSAFSQVRR